MFVCLSVYLSVCPSTSSLSEIATMWVNWSSRELSLYMVIFDPKAGVISGSGTTACYRPSVQVSEKPLGIYLTHNIYLTDFMYIYAVGVNRSMCVYIMCVI